MEVTRLVDSAVAFCGVFDTHNFVLWLIHKIIGNLVPGLVANHFPLSRPAILAN
jgi:hypothetical protein